MTDMNISLAPELASLVQAKVDTGLYSDASEVISEAIRHMDISSQFLYQYKLDQLKKALEPGMQQALAGEYADYSLASFISELDQDSNA